MNRRSVILGLVAFGAIALIASLLYVVHMPQPSALVPGAPRLISDAPGNSPIAPISISSYDASTSFPSPSGSCVSSSSSGDADGSSDLCINASEPEPPYWKPLTGQFLAFYPTSGVGIIPTDTSLYTVNFGDGNTGTLHDDGASCSDTSSLPCIQKFSTEHTYLAAGQYTVRFYKDGLQIADTLELTIAIPSSVCTLEDILIPSGTGISAYDDHCNSEDRVCRNGILSGTYEHARCPLKAQ
jgi:hypothetical protein